MTRQDLNKLKKLLPKKYSLTIAEKCNVSESYVRKVLSGNADRLDVIDQAIELAKDHQDKMIKRSELISSL